MTDVLGQTTFVSLWAFCFMNSVEAVHQSRNIGTRLVKVSTNYSTRSSSSTRGARSSTVLLRKLGPTLRTWASNPFPGRVLQITSLVAQTPTNAGFHLADLLETHPRPRRLWNTPFLDRHMRVIIMTR
jgi:uncharacterized membrane protein YbaN (DUF454 family)